VQAKAKANAKAKAKARPGQAKGSQSVNWGGRRIAIHASLRPTVC